jgi:nucleoside phosphorylase
MDMHGTTRKTKRSVESGADVLVLTGIGFAAAAAAATLLYLSVGMTRLALFLAVG